MKLFSKKNEADEYVSKPVSFSPSPSNPTANNKTDTNSHFSVIGKTILVKGRIFSDEQLLVEGTIEGQRNINNTVNVGETGVINADIEAREVVIKGTVNGNVKGHYKVEIVPEGVLNGNILSQRVKLADGAVFKGSIDMTLKEKGA